MSNHGGPRPGAGRPRAPEDHKPDNVSICVRISRKNNKRLRSGKGKIISRLVDKAITEMFERADRGQGDD